MQTNAPKLVMGATTSIDHQAVGSIVLPQEGIGTSGDWETERERERGGGGREREVEENMNASTGHQAAWSIVQPQERNRNITRLRN